MNFLKKGIVVTGGRFSGIFINMLAGILFARTLGPGGLGQFELFRSTQTLVVTIFSLGMGNAGIYFLNNKKIPLQDIVSITLKFSLFLCLIILIFAPLAITFYPDYFGEVSSLSIILFTLGAAALLNSTTLRPILTAQLAARRMIIVDLIPRIILFTFAILIYFLKLKNADWAILALGLGYTLAFLSLLFFFKEFIVFKNKFDWSLFKTILSYGIKLSASGLMVVLTSNITIVFLRLFQEEGFNNIGQYSRAVAISSILIIIPTTIGPLLYAKWANINDTTLAKQSSMVIRVGLFLSAGTSFFVILFSEWIVKTLYGNEFLDAVQAVKILVAGLIFVSIYSVCNNILASKGKAIITFKIFIITFIIVAGLSAILIPIYGINGAAIAVFSGNLFTGIAALLICKKLFGLRILHSLILKREDFGIVKKMLTND